VAKTLPAGYRGEKRMKQSLLTDMKHKMRKAGKLLCKHQPMFFIVTSREGLTSHLSKVPVDREAYA